jgi:hypothetical protein
MKQVKQLKHLKHFSTPKTAKIIAKARLLGRFFGDYLAKMPFLGRKTIKKRLFLMIFCCFLMRN